MFFHQLQKHVQRFLIVTPHQRKNDAFNVFNEILIFGICNESTENCRFVKGIVKISFYAPCNMYYLTHLRPIIQ